MNIDSYVYQYVREDGSPYYIGKGTGKRAYNRCKGDVKPLKDKSNVQVIAHNLSDSEASVLEKKLIKLYGRKDIGTGILRNKTDGGDGATGAVRSKEFRDVIAANNRLRKGIQKHTAEWKAANAERMKSNQYGVGKLHTDEWKIANGERMAGNQYAKVLKGRKHPIVTCPHCNSAGGQSGMKRWHFDNCQSIK
jgi:hypothetical protein